jgi:hypothetical protein
MAECIYCRQEADTRPYGPGGAQVCHPCITSDPERERAAGNVFMGLLDANEAISPSGVVMIGEEGGPRPFDPDEAP